MFDRIKKLFAKNHLSVGLINYGNILNVPDRDYYKNDQEVLYLIDSYKRKYFNILNTKRTVLSKELELDNLQREILMNIDIVLHSINEEDISSLAKEALMIGIYKIKLYMEEIQKMELETTIRLIALRELVNNRRVPRRNRKALIEEINHLGNTLVLFFAQKNALQRELNAYLTSVNVREDEIDNMVLDNLYEKLLFLSKDIVSWEEIDLFDSKVLKIVFIERQLELYAYQNEEEIEELISKFIIIRNKNYTDTYPMIELLVDLEKVEAKMLVFFEYGKRSFDKKHLENLYRTKFNIHMKSMFQVVYRDENRIVPCDYYDYNKSIYTDNGYPYYLDIIMEKISDIFQGRNDIFNNVFKGKERKALNIISDYIKSVGNGSFDSYSVSHNEMLLGLIMSFDSEMGFYRLKNMKALAKENLKERDFKGIDWLDKMPFTDVLKMNDLFPSEKTNHPIYKLYKLVNWLDYLDDGFDAWSFPKSITEINFAEMDEQNLKAIREKVIARKVYLPFCLEKIERGDLVFGTNVKMIYQNKGLKEIGDRGLWGDYSLQDDRLYIDANIIRIHENAYNIAKVKRIVFEDYNEDNKILHNPELLNEFLRRFARAKYDFNNEYSRYEKRVYLDLDCIELLKLDYNIDFLEGYIKTISVKDIHFTKEMVDVDCDLDPYNVTYFEMSEIVDQLYNKMENDDYQFRNYEATKDNPAYHGEKAVYVLNRDYSVRYDKGCF